MSKVLIGLQFNKKNVEYVGIYDLQKDKLDLISTKEAKKSYQDKTLFVENADFNFFVNSVNFHIGEQEQYPLIFENNRKKKIENGIIIYDINKTDDNKYKTLIVSTRKIKQEELGEEELKKLYNSNSYKCNYIVEDDKLKISYKENGVQKELDLFDEDWNEELFNKFNEWYKVHDGRMEKVTDCNQSKFEIKHGELIIDGFMGSDVIEEADLSGATYVAPKAFYGCKNLKKVILSESLQQIGSQAFYNCPNLKELSIPKSCTQIGIRIFDNGTVYLENDLSKQEDIITPFGAKTKIILNGKQIELSEDIKVAYYETKTLLYYYNINRNKYNAEKIKKKDIDFLDTFINYSDDKVLTSDKAEDFIVCGKIGKEFLVINSKDGDWKNATISQKSFDELKSSGGSPIDGTYTSDDIIPLNPEWGWFEIGNNKKSATAKIGSQLTELNDTGKILKDNEKIIMADYINKKFETKYGKIVLGSAKSTKKSKEEKDKFPGYTWIYGGQYPGGIACDNPPKIDKKTGKNLGYIDEEGDYYCYFGHKTHNHIMAKGYKGDQLMATFTFGIKCASDFLEIDMGALSKIKEFQGILTSALDEITEVIKNKSYAQYIAKHKNFYEILDYIKKAKKFELLGPYGDIIRRCLEANIIIPKALRDDIVINDPFEVFSLCVKNKNNLDLIYNYPILNNLNDKKYDDEYYTLENTQDKLNDYLKFYEPPHYSTPKNLQEVNDLIDSVKVDKEAYNKMADIKQEFDKLNLTKGKYVLADVFYVNTNRCEIIDFSKAQRETDDKYKTLCSLTKKLDPSMTDFFINKVDKTDIRPTHRHPLYEYKYIKQARMLNDLLDISNISDNKVKYITGVSYRDKYEKRNMIALAYKNNLYGWGVTNSNKPIYLIKDGKINVDGEFGIIESMKKSKDLYTYFFSHGINNTRGLIEKDIPTSNFKYSTINQLVPGELTAEQKQAYIDLINGFDSSKYNKRGFNLGLPANIEDLYEILSVDLNKSFIIIHEEKISSGIYKSFIIYKKDKETFIYSGSEHSDSSDCIGEVDFNNPIGKVEDGVDCPNINPNAYYYLIYLDNVEINNEKTINNLNLLIDLSLNANNYRGEFVLNEDNTKGYYVLNSSGEIRVIGNENYFNLLEDNYRNHCRKFIWINETNDKSIINKVYDDKLLEPEDLNKTLENIEQDKINREKEEQERLEREAKEAQEAEERRLQEEQKEQEKENHYLEVEKKYEELNKYRAQWSAMKIDNKYLSQFNLYRRRSFDYILKAVEREYDKLQKYLAKVNKPAKQPATPNNINLSNEFIQALKDNIQDVDKWIGDNRYTNAYIGIGNNIIKGKGIVGNQDRIVKHIKSDLEKYLNTTFPG